jgi:hypothetical protein
MGSLNRIGRAATASHFDTDFYAWTLDQAARIRGARMPGLDNENIAEEIESLGRSQKHRLSSRCDVLLAHLLNWRFQPERRGESWMSTIDEQRRAIDIVLSDSPSLRRAMPHLIAHSYRYALRKAARETALPLETFPASCPWTPGEILDEDWMPPS